jgi:hypothetical protein
VSEVSCQMVQMSINDSSGAFQPSTTIQTVSAQPDSAPGLMYRGESICGACLLFLARLEGLKHRLHSINPAAGELRSSIPPSCLDVQVPSRLLQYG